MSQVSKELKYTSEVANHTSLVNSRIIPQGSDSVTLSASSTSEMLIEIPNKVYNLADSSLQFKMAVPAVASNVTALHTQGANMIDSIELYSRGGQYLVQLNNVSQYNRVVLPVTKKHQEVRSMDASIGGTSQAIADNGSSGSNLFLSQAAASTTPTTGMTHNGSRILAGGADANGAIFKSYGQDLNNFVVSAVNTAMYFKFDIPLSQIAPHTLLSMKKLFYAGQNLMLRIRWNATDRMGFQTTNADCTSAALSAITAAIALSDVRLNLKIETNPAIVSALVNKVNSSGLQFIVPYVHGYTYNSASGTSSGYTQRLNPSHGQRLLHVISALFHNTNSAGSSLDVSNVGDDKVVSFENSLDNNKLHEVIPLTCAQNDDYQHLKPILEGSCIESAQQYKYNRCWIESFRKGKSCEWVDNDDVIDGIDLSSERTYHQQYTTASAAYRQYYWFVCQRTLSVSPSGEIVVA